MMIFTAEFLESMRGEPIHGSVKLTGGVADLVSEVSVDNVSAKSGMSGKSLCNCNDIRELVRASHNCSYSAEVDGRVDYGASMVCIRSTLVLLAASIHSFAACRTSSWICHWVDCVLLCVVTC